MGESITTIQAVTSLAFCKTETFDLGPLHGRDAREMPGIVRFRRFRASDIWFRHTKLAKNCLDLLAGEDGYPALHMRVGLNHRLLT